MDEPTAMLDPEGKEDIQKIVKKLKKEGYTIIYITNIIDEIFISDRVVVLEKGKFVKEFQTKDILKNIEFLKEKEIRIPKSVEILQKLEEKGIKINLEEIS